jgi:hypothetical protein
VLYGNVIEPLQTLHSMKSATFLPTILSPLFLVKANTALVWFETNRLLAEWFALIQARKDGEYHGLDLIPELMEVCDALCSQ